MWTPAGVQVQHMYPGRRREWIWEAKSNLPQMLKNLVELLGKERSRMRWSDSGLKHFPWAWKEDWSKRITSWEGVAVTQMCNVEGLSQGFLGDKVKEVNYMTSKTFSTLRIRLLGYELLLIAMSLSQFFFLSYFILFIFGHIGSSLWCAGFSLRWLLLLRSTGSRRAGFSSCGSRAPERMLSSCGARAQLLRGMWDPPGRGLEPMSPALAGRFSTTAPPGKP